MLSKLSEIRRLAAAVTGIFFLELVTSLPGFCGDSRQIENFRRNWAEHGEIRPDGLIEIDSRSPIALGSSKCGSGPAPSYDYLEPIILHFFDSSKLDSTSKLQYCLDFKSGAPKVLKKPELSEKEKFYCEQAIWEATPFSKIVEHPMLETIEFKRGNGGGGDFESDWRFFKKHPELKGNVVTAHIIPASVRDLFRQVIPYIEIYSIKNTSAIKLSDVDSDGLAGYRKDWLDYIEAHKADKITREAVVEQAVKLLEKYPNLFVL